MNSGLDFPSFLEQIGVLSSELKENLFDNLTVELDPGAQMRVLVEKSGLDQQTLDYYVSEWNKTPFTVLDDIDRECVTELPEKICRRFEMMAFQRDGERLCIAAVNPYNDGVMAAIGQWTSLPYTIYITPKEALKHAINRSFRQTGSITDLAQTAKSVAIADQVVKLHEDGIDRLNSKASVVNMLDHLLQDAVQCQATDVHIEANFNHLVYYYRMGHETSEIVFLPLEIANMLVQRLLILGDGDIAQRSLPQDLGFSFKRQGTNEIINVRLSILFTLTGYSVVMRMLLSEAEIHSLEDILVDKKTLEVVKDFLRSEHGMMLVTGPTASGKTTLLYSLLKEVSGGRKKVITIEDPVEIQFSYLNQVQINTDIGLDFAEVIRSSLRQNPDVLMVGEIRDQVTANMAMRSAMTGVLVFSTMHTSNTKKTITRLIDLDVDPFLVGSALRLVLASRLLRCICPSCPSEPRELTQDECRLLKSELEEGEVMTVVEGKGCQLCQQTGVRGMTMIVERLLLTSEGQEAVIRGDLDAFEKQADKSLKGVRLADYAKQLAKEGRIPVGEYIKLVCDV